MAIVIRGSSSCAICSEVLEEDNSILIFPAFIEDETHPLFNYSDSAVHKLCFAGWQERERLIETFNSYYQVHYRGLMQMSDSGEIFEPDSP